MALGARGARQQSARHGHCAVRARAFVKPVFFFISIALLLYNLLSPSLALGSHAGMLLLLLLLLLLFLLCRLIADLNFVTVSADAANSRALIVSVLSSSGESEMFSGRFIFDDTIRCVAGRQVLCFFFFFFLISFVCHVAG